MKKTIFETETDSEKAYKLFKGITEYLGTLGERVIRDHGFEGYFVHDHNVLLTYSRAHVFDGLELVTKVNGYGREKDLGEVEKKILPVITRI